MSIRCFYLGTIAALMLALLPSTRAEAAIPLFNGTCPGNLEVHADEGGPVYVNGRQTQVKRLAEDAYEATDNASGVTLSISRTPDGGVQMSYSGKNRVHGVCTVGEARPASAPAYSPARRASDSHGEVTCESNGGAQVECDMDTRGDVRIVRQLSRTECVQGRNWGLYHHSVWVKDGCRAVFSNEGKDRSFHPAAPISMENAAELLGSCNVKADARGTLVTRVPMNKDVTELIIDYPDGRFLCIARNDGFVMSLTHIRGK